MSETDDTDVLLLIPPNFFLVQSSDSDNSFLESSRTVVHKPASCTAQVLGKLVDQVHSLESRLESLELTTTSDISSNRTPPRRRNSDTDSFEERSLERKCFTFPRRRRRKAAIKKKRDLSLTSLDSASTFEKHIPPLNLKSVSNKPTKVNDTPSMDADLSSIVSTPNKKNDKLLLNEIDEFLTKVESYESPESKYKTLESLSPENVIKATGDYISQKLEGKISTNEVKQTGTVHSAILNKYIYLVKSNPESASDKSLPSSSYKGTYKDTTVQSDVTKHDAKSLPSKSPSVRRLSYSDGKDIQVTSTPKQTPQSHITHDSFRPSSNKIYDRATKVLEQYKSQSYNNQNTSNIYLSSLKKEEFKMPQMRPYSEKEKFSSLQNKLIDSIDTDLLSLSELWGERGDRERVDNIKLEEERLKREHCEAMIQQLQKKILEQQEKIAVAIKVDRAKDTAISRLKEAWLRLTGSLERAEERHRSALDKMVTEVGNFKMVADDAQKKTNHFETELYKALDLAHDYQEKCKQLIAEKKELQENIHKDISNNNMIIESKDKDIEVLKENYETVMRLNKQSTDCVKNLEDSLQSERQDHELTKSKLNELNHKIQTINEETSLVQQERDLLKEKVNEERARYNMLDRQLCEKESQNGELLKKCDNLENEIKSLQKHIELQKNELKVHYQKQLEDAVLSKLQEFQQQLDQAEREMEHNARSKENAIVDTYNKQIVRIEEQHKLEVNLLEEKQKEEIKLYRLQLAQAAERISLLENKLESYRRRRGQIASQLHSVMESQWRQALLILTNPTLTNPTPIPNSTLDLTRLESSATPVAQDYAPPKIPPLTMPVFADKGIVRESRRRDNVFNFEALSDHELQQYVKLLLTKPANLDGSGERPREPSADMNEEPTSDRPETQERRDKAAKRCLGNKPPWKS